VTIYVAHMQYFYQNPLTHVTARPRAGPSPSQVKQGFWASIFILFRPLNLVLHILIIYQKSNTLITYLATAQR